MSLTDTVPSAESRVRFPDDVVIVLPSRLKLSTVAAPVTARVVPLKVRFVSAVIVVPPVRTALSANDVTPVPPLPTGRVPVTSLARSI